jgi:hypothetical protein
VYRLDDLYLGDDQRGAFWPGQRVALLKLDVEGQEPNVIRGGLRLVQRDRPIITTEVLVQSARGVADDLFALLDAQQYDSYLVDEIAGVNLDCRNVIHVPRERRRQSATLDLASATSAIAFVANASELNRAVDDSCLGSCKRLHDVGVGRLLETGPAAMGGPKAWEDRLSLFRWTARKSRDQQVRATARRMFADLKTRERVSVAELFLTNRSAGAAGRRGPSRSLAVARTTATAPAPATKVGSSCTIL